MGLPRSRSEAKRLGSPTYFTAKPCKFGHLDKRNTKTGRCYECARQATRRFNARNPEKKRVWDKQYAERNPEKVAENMRRWKERNPDGRKRWREANPDHDRNWKKANPEKVAATARRVYLRKMQNPKSRVESAVRAGVVKGIRKGSKSARRTFELLGYTLGELCAHLEAQFLPGMSWENYGFRGWHIDHKRPLASFNYETPDDPEFKEAWALSNLQPLWWQDNLSKHDTWDGSPIAANDNEPKKKDAA